MAYAGIPPASFTNNLTNVQLIDDISGSFNGSTQTFALTSGSAPFHAVSARSLVVILGGIVQKPGTDYTVDGGNITFTTAPVSGLTFAARNIYGLNYLNNVNDGVITPAKLSTGGPYWDTSNNVGIGTTNPNEILHLHGSSSKSILRFTSQTYGSSATDGSFIGINFGGFDIWHRQDNYLRLATNNTERLRITSTGNIGIGTDNPTTKLELQSSYTVSATNHFATFARNGGAINAVIGYNAVTLDYMYIGTGTAHPFGLRSNNTLALYIDTNQNVGIGTNNPTQKLDVVGNFLVTSVGTSTITSSTSGRKIEFEPQNIDSEFRIYTNYVGGKTGRYFLETFDGTTQKNYLDHSGGGYFAGNVGIGVTNPDLTLHVDGVNALPSTSGSTPTGHLTLRAKSTASSHGMFMGVSNAAPWSSWIQAQDANNNATTYPLLLNPNGGSVVVGTTTTSAINSGPFSGETPKLEIRLGGASTSYTRLVNISNPGAQSGSETLGRVGIKFSLGSEANSGESNKSGIIYAESTSAYNNGTSLCFATNNTERLRIDSNGNVGIGTNNPTRTLQVSSSGINNAYILMTTDGTGHTDGDGSQLRLNRSTDNLDIQNLENAGITFHTNGESEKVRITSTGNVGIATDNPPGRFFVLGPNTYGQSSFVPSGTGALGVSQNQPYGAMSFRNNTDAGNMNYTSWIQSSVGANTYIDVLIINGGLYRILVKGSANSTVADVAQFMIYGLNQQTNSYPPRIEKVGDGSNVFSTSIVSWNINQYDCVVRINCSRGGLNQGVRAFVERIY